jgi:multidrug efflux pump subunit AcrB
VALSIPLVLAIVFMAMEAMGISLQRISLGALIIALGLLVDDAMITIEMMISKIEEGMEKVKAATFAYTSTAFPMLTGTLITIFGFLPIGFADNNTGQYTFSLFAVVAVALVASWFVAVIFAPVIGLRASLTHQGTRRRQLDVMRALAVCSVWACGTAGSPSPPRSLPAPPSTVWDSCSSSSFGLNRPSSW